MPRLAPPHPILTLARALLVVCALMWAAPGAAQPALDDRYQTKLPRTSAPPPLELESGDGGGGGGGDVGAGGEGEQIDLRGDGTGEPRERSGGGIREMLERVREHVDGEEGEPGQPRGDSWSRRDRGQVYFPDRFDPNAPPREGTVEWYDGRKSVFRDGQWSELGPPDEGDVERRADQFTRRFENGQWGEWQPPPEGAVEWDDGYKRTFEDGQWSPWQQPEEGDVELRGDRQRVFRDGEWTDWQERSELADRRERQRPHDVDSDDLARNDPMMQRSPSACECSGINLGGSLGGVGQAIFWIVLAIVVLALIVMIARYLRGRLGKDDDDSVEDDEDDDLFDDDEDDEDDLELAEAPGAGGALLEALEAPLPDHERLAAEGRWAEALHALLLHVLAGLLEGRALRTKSALTSRELVELFGLDAERRDALWRIVEAVEISHFGMRPTTREAYEAARADAHRVQAAPVQTREAA